MHLRYGKDSPLTSSGGPQYRVLRKRQVERCFFRCVQLAYRCRAAFLPRRNLKRFLN